MTLFNLNLVTRIAQLQSGPRPAQVWPMTGAPIFHPCPQNRIKISLFLAMFFTFDFHVFTSNFRLLTFSATCYGVFHFGVA